jgi:hypothetical protein
MFGQEWAGVGAGFIIALILALWAVFNIVGDPRTPPIWKATWTAFVLFVPLFGFLIWLLFGPRAPKTS